MEAGIFLESARHFWYIDGDRAERERERVRFSYDKCGLLLNVSAYSGIIHFQDRKVRYRENSDRDNVFS